MDLEYQSIICLDFEDSENGYPEDINDFSVMITINIGEKEKMGSEVFYLNVCSPSQLAKTESGKFISSTLVLDEFDWNVLKNRLNKILDFCRSARDWNEVILRLATFFKYADEDIWKLT